MYPSYFNGVGWLARFRFCSLIFLYFPPGDYTELPNTERYLYP